MATAVLFSPLSLAEIEQWLALEEEQEEDHRFRDHQFVGFAEARRRLPSVGFFVCLARPRLVPFFPLSVEIEMLRSSKRVFWSVCACLLLPVRVGGHRGR